MQPKDTPTQLNQRSTRSQNQKVESIDSTRLLTSSKGRLNPNLIIQNPERSTSLNPSNKKQNLNKRSQSSATKDIFGDQDEKAKNNSSKQSKVRASRSQSGPANKQQTKPSNKNKQGSSPQDQNEKKVVFKEGTLVAFLDRDAVAKCKVLIHIGKILNNTTIFDRKINLIQFKSGVKPRGAKTEGQTDLPLTFKTSNYEPSTIKDYQVICVVVAQENQKKLVDPLSITITKQSALEAGKLVNNIFDSVIQKINDEDDAAAEAESEELKSEESENSDEIEEVKQIPQRVILRGKRSLDQKTNLTQDVRMRRSGSKSINYSEIGNAQIKQPKIGVKRQYPSSIQKISTTQNVRKVKNISDGTGEQIFTQVQAPKKAKKAKKEEPTFKLGKYNNTTVLLTQQDEKERYSANNDPIYNCCLRCNCRNVVRAVENNNIPLLIKLIKDVKNVPSITEPWSTDATNINLLEIIFKNHKKDMLEKILKLAIKNLAKTDQTETDAENLFINERVKVPDSLIEEIDTGMVSDKAYGYGVRKVQMTRGNRQGNQAFLNGEVNPKNPFNIKDDDQQKYFNKYVTVELYKLYSLLTNQPEPDADEIIEFALCGNINMLQMIIKPLIKHDHYGFNNLHLDVLTLNKVTDKINTTSITKKCSKSFITPLHLACLNPNKQVIQTLINQNKDINVQDSMNNKPIHYAAICPQNGSLQVLIAKGANVLDLNKRKQTPLHFAAMNSRAQNVKTILENSILGLKIRDKQENKTAFVYALEQGDLETIKAFLDYSQDSIKINSGQGINRMSPLMYAATYGRFELAQYLIEERKAKVLSKDKFKRTALIMAVRNGHLRLASLLLKHGSDWNHKDSSDNTPLHYAAGAGFGECIELLISHGANINAANMWKVTPITIAMMNNHNGIVKRLLQQPNVDINGKDDKGLTLLQMAIISIDAGGDFNFLKFLIEKGADVNLADMQKRTPLHFLMQNSNKQIENKDYFDFIKYFLDNGADLNALDYTNQNSILSFLKNCKNPLRNESKNYFKEILFLLIEKGVNINQIDNNGKSPIHLLFSNLTYAEEIKNPIFTQIVNLFIEKGANFQQKNSKNQSLVNVLIEQTAYYRFFTCKELAELLKILIKNGADVNVIGKSGTPIVSLIANFLKFVQLSSNDSSYRRWNYTKEISEENLKDPKQSVADIIIDILDKKNKKINDNLSQIISADILPGLKIEQSMRELCQILILGGANLGLVENEIDSKQKQSEVEEKKLKVDNEDEEEENEQEDEEESVKERNQIKKTPALHLIIESFLQLNKDHQNDDFVNQILEIQLDRLQNAQQKNKKSTDRSISYAKMIQFQKQDKEIKKSLHRYKIQIISEITIYLIDLSSDVNQVDQKNSNTCLHLLTQSQKQKKQIFVNRFCDRLLLKNPNLTLLNKNKKTPFDIALDNDNIELLEKFVFSVRLSKDPDFLHKFAPKITDERYRNLIVKMLEIDHQNLNYEILNALDQSGFTPLLRYVQHFTEILNSQKTNQKIKQFLLFKIFQLREIGNLNIESELSKDVTNSAIESFKLNNQKSFDKYKILEKDTQWFIKEVTEISLNQNISQILEKHYYKPFIKFLDQFIKAGANPNQKVQKTKFYRDLEVYMTQLKQSSDNQIENLLIENLTLINQPENKILYEKRLQEIKLLTRDQQVLELKNTFYQKNDQYAQFLIQMSNKEFSSYYGAKRNPNDLEIEYELQFGLQNVIHLVINQQPHNQLYSFFADIYKVQVDEIDFQGRTPFHINILDFPKRAEMFECTKDLLYKKRIRYELPFFDGATPFLHVYQNGNIELANTLLKHGANINHIDNQGNFALKQALLLKDNEEICDEIKRLVSLGAEINLKDHQGRNVLHHTINNSSATADASFEAEQLLIDLGININQQDDLGRVPLHYAFVKIQNQNIISQIDPIQTVSSLCRYQKLEIDVADKWKKTPLHYAASRSSVICSIYLLQRGAKLEQKDIYGNTALAISLLNKHFSYAIVLIQKFADVKTPIFEEIPHIYEQKWALDKKISKSLSLDDEMIGQETNDQQILKDLNEKILAQTPTSTFKRSIQNDQQGLAFLILDNGFNYMYAMQDSLDDKKFKLVLTLLSKITDSKIVQLKNENQQNLMHILAKNSQGGQVRVFQRIYDNLKSHGVNCLEKDGFGSTALHYAVACNCLELSQVLVKEGVDVNVINNDGDSAITLLLKGNQGLTMDLQIESLFQLLFKNGAQLNLIYPEQDFNSYVCKVCINEFSQPDKECGVCKTQLNHSNQLKIKDYRCSIMINLIRRNYSKNELLNKNIEYLLDNGANLNILDTIGRDVLIYATINQNASLIELLFAKSNRGLMKKHKDLFGLEVENYIVNSKNLGSKNSIETIQQLLKIPKLITLSPVDYSGKDLLMHAAIQNNKDLTKLLTSNHSCGLRKNHIDNNGNTVLNHMMISGRLGNKENLQILELILAIKDLISLSSVDVKGRDALIYGIKQNNLELVNILINNRGQNLLKNHSNLKRKTVTHFIMKSNSLGDEINLQILTKILSIKNLIQLSAVDQEGRDILMMAIRQNNKQLVELLIKNADQNLLQNHQDNQGKTALHYVVNPLPYGSYENIQILDLILQSGLNYDLKTVDNLGLSPFDYSLQQSSGVLSRKIAQVLKIKKFSTQNHYLPANKWLVKYNFDQDAKKLIQDAKLQKAENLKDDQDYIELDEEFQGHEQYKVYFHNKRPYDTYLTKVDLKNGIHGEFNFYKIQMVYDSNRELYIVLTRYGRIGEEGMHQQTPFNSVDEAMKDFQSIFKKKTGNDWLTALELFEKQPKKYSLVDTDYTNVDHEELLLPFDYKNSPASNLQKYEQKILKQFSDVALQRRIIQKLKIDTDKMPLSRLNDSTIEQAKEILNELEVVIKEFKTFRTESMDDLDIDDQYEQTKEYYNQLQELSSKFYQLIPMSDNSSIKFWEVKPITDFKNLKKRQEQVNKLTEIEYCSRILLGALYQQKNVNPVDYIQNSIQVQFNQIQNDNPEFKLIENYIKQTSESDLYHLKLFKVQRRGEGEKFARFENFKNRHLLFHGTSVTNMLGILSKGLMISPQDSVKTGNNFGKGLYFADKFSKSQSYSKTNNPRKNVMLLCEVALGNPFKMYSRFELKELPKGFDSVHAVGSEGINFSSNSTVKAPEGFLIAQDPPECSIEPTKSQFIASEKYGNENDWSRFYNEKLKQFNWELTDNEFVVYNTDQVKIHYVVQWSDFDYKVEESQDYSANHKRQENNSDDYEEMNNSEDENSNQNDESDKDESDKEEEDEEEDENESNQDKSDKENGEDEMSERNSDKENGEDEMSERNSDSSINESCVDEVNERSSNQSDQEMDEDNICKSYLDNSDQEMSEEKNESSNKSSSSY